MGIMGLLLFQQRPTNMKVVACLALFCLVAVSAKSSGLAVEQVLKQDDSTTVAPSTSTAAPSTTTAAPSTTTGTAPSTTTVGPSTTTGAAPSTTTVGPETTTGAAPSTTTGGPATTTVEETTTAGTPAVNLAASLVLLVPVVKYL